MDLLSPGELSRPHAALEGTAHCTKCHPAGGKLAAEPCLACHEELRGRIAAGKGLHGRIPAADRACERCHHEHEGRDFALVSWGKERTGDLRPRADRDAARREAREGRLREVPRPAARRGRGGEGAPREAPGAQDLPRRAGRVLAVPRGRAPRPDRHRLREVPRRRRLEAGAALRPREGRVQARRSATRRSPATSATRAKGSPPPETGASQVAVVQRATVGPVQGAQVRRLRRLPQGPPPREVRPRLHLLPPRGRLEEADRRGGGEGLPREDEVPAPRWPRERAVQELPRPVPRREGEDEGDRVRRLHRLPRRRARRPARPAAGGAAHLRPLPRGRGLAPGPLRARGSRPEPLPAGGRPPGGRLRGLPPEGSRRRGALPRRGPEEAGGARAAGEGGAGAPEDREERRLPDLPQGSARAASSTPGSRRRGARPATRARPGGRSGSTTRATASTRSLGATRRRPAAPATGPRPKGSSATGRSPPPAGRATPIRTPASSRPRGGGPTARVATRPRRGRSRSSSRTGSPSRSSRSRGSTRRSPARSATRRWRSRPA